MNFFGVIERAAAPFLAKLIQDDYDKGPMFDSGEKEFQVNLS